VISSGKNILAIKGHRIPINLRFATFFHNDSKYEVFARNIDDIYRLASVFLQTLNLYSVVM